MSLWGRKKKTQPEPAAPAAAAGNGNGGAGAPVAGNSRREPVPVPHGVVSGHYVPQELVKHTQDGQPAGQRRQAAGPKAGRSQVTQPQTGQAGRAKANLPQIGLSKANQSVADRQQAGPSQANRPQPGPSNTARPQPGPSNTARPQPGPAKAGQPQAGQAAGTGTDRAPAAAGREQVDPAGQAGAMPADAVLAEPAMPRPGGIDWWLFVLMVMLLGIGLVMVLSASGIVAVNEYGDKYYYFKRQLIYASLGGVLMCAVAAVSRRLIYRLHYVFLFLALFLLLLTLSPLAPSINGAHRWIRVGPVSVQPMEFVKIALALYLAYYMSEKQDLVKTFFRGILPPFLVTVLFCSLLMLQPDFGSSVVLVALLFCMCLAGGTSFLYLILAFLLGLATMGLLAILEPYRMRRLMAFLDPFADAQNTGYQLVQSLYAIGSGSFFGVGMGASRQKMFYLPEAHNDFIMAVLAEELGFVGVSVVMLLFALFFWRCYLVIQGQSVLRDRLTAFALTAILCMGVILNLAVVMGMAPPKGVPMPLLSYGGSNLVATMICVGLLLNLSRTARLPHT